MAYVAFDPLIPVMDRHVRGWPRTDGQESGPAQYGPISEALTQTFEWDAHFAAYSLPSVPHRLAGTSVLVHRPRMVLVVFDVDAPGHVWTPSWWALEEPKVRDLIRQRGRAWVGTTRGGYRIIYALAEPFEISDAAARERWSASYMAWCGVLREERGIVADTSCADWTRLYRLPRVRRDGVDAVPEREIGEPDRIGRWTEPLLSADDPRCLPPPAPAVPPEAAAPVPEDDLVAAAQALGAAWPARGRHYSTLALCGALARLGWTEEAIADFVVTVCALGGDDDVAHHQRLAREAADRAARGDELAGWESLAEHMATGADGTHDDELVAPVTAAVLSARRALGDTPPQETWAAVAAAARPTTPSAEEIAVQALGPGATPEEVDRFRMTLDWAAEHFLAASSAIGAAAAATPKKLFLSSRELHAQNHPPPAWLVRDLIIRGGVGALATEPKVGKSWIATEIGVGLASGTSVLGRFAVDRPGRVAYFYAEDDAGAIVVRQCALARPRNLASDAWLDRFMVQPRGRTLDLTRDVDCAILIASTVAGAGRREGAPPADGAPPAAGDTGIDLLILDPLSDLHSGEEDKRDSMAPIMRRLRAIAQVLGCAVLFVHHAMKASADSTRRRPGQRMRGSSAIHGAVDFGIYLDFDDDKSDKKARFVSGVTSEVKGARGGGEFELTLQITDDEEGHAREARWSVGARIAAKAEVAEDKVASICQRLFDHGAPLTRDEIKRKVGGASEVIAKAMAEAITAGFVVQRMNGNRSAGYELTPAGRDFVRVGRAPTAEPAPEPPAGGLLAGFLAGRMGGDAARVRSE